ncbi:MAG: hypothetical protein AABY07_10800 [Nanoarchaeota archaeon]
MEKLLEILLNLIQTEWFGAIVIAPLVAYLVDRFFMNRRDLKHKLAQIMLQVEKNHPEWSGEEKKQFVVNLINGKNKYAKQIPNSLIEAMIDAVIAEIKEEAELIRNEQ